VQPDVPPEFLRSVYIDALSEANVHGAPHAPSSLNERFDACIQRVKKKPLCTPPLLIREIRPV